MTCRRVSAPAHAILCGRRDSAPPLLDALVASRLPLPLPSHRNHAPLRPPSAPRHRARRVRLRRRCRRTDAAGPREHHPAHRPGGGPRRDGRRRLRRRGKASRDGRRRAERERPRVRHPLGRCAGGRAGRGGLRPGGRRPVHRVRPEQRSVQEVLPGLRLHAQETARGPRTRGYPAPPRDRRRGHRRGRAGDGPARGGSHAGRRERHQDRQDRRWRAARRGQQGGLA